MLVDAEATIIAGNETCKYKKEDVQLRMKHDHKIRVVAKTPETSSSSCIPEEVAKQPRPVPWVFSVLPLGDLARPRQSQTFVGSYEG